MQHQRRVQHKIHYKSFEKVSKNILCKQFTTVTTHKKFSKLLQ